VTTRAQSLVVTETAEPPGWLVDKSAAVRLGRSPEYMAPASEDRAVTPGD
jgi:hypothetical protein